MGLPQYVSLKVASKSLGLSAEQLYKMSVAGHFRLYKDQPLHEKGDEYDIVETLIFDMDVFDEGDESAVDDDPENMYFFKLYGDLLLIRHADFQKMEARCSPPKPDLADLADLPGKLQDRLSRLKRAWRIPPGGAGFPISGKDKILAEIKAISEWLEGKREHPSTFDDAVLEEFPLDYQVDQTSCLAREDGGKERSYPTGGQPQGTLRDAVELAYDRLSDSGNTETIKSGKITSFLQYLKDSISAGNENYSEVLAGMLKEVKHVKGDCRIIIHPKTKREVVQFADTGKNIEYDKNAVSKILTDLRSKKK
jgi:mRNA-degrading endonuclease YafQ of YafQ-DinJ toxin-antitoxin module